MKIKLDIDCTPEEARRFLGLPDIAEMQQNLIKLLQEKMTENINAMDAETMMQTWLPMTLQGLENMQKTFWSQMNQMAKAGQNENVDES